MPADSPNVTPLIYHQKLEVKYKEIYKLIGTIISKNQKNTTINWKVIKELIPDRSPSVANIRDTLSSKLRFDNLLEFLCKYSYDNNKSENSYSFVSCTSSNIDRNVKNLHESTIFAELFLKLICKDWEAKLSKMNCYVQAINEKNLKRKIKIFSKAEFLIGHALIIGATYYSQSGSVLFRSNNNGQ